MNLHFREEHVAGDTFDMTVEVVDYPASDGWTLKYRLVPQFATPTQAPIVMTAVTNADGKRYDVQASPASTAAWTAGFYTWSRWVEKSGARQTLDESGQLEVKADPATIVQGFNSRSHARKMLEAIETALEGFAANPVMKSYAVGTRQYLRAEIPELLRLRQYYEIAVRTEVAANALEAGTGLGRKIQVRL